MISLTRLNNSALTINSDLIKFIENAPDTVITLTTGEKVVVRESTEDVLRKVISFRRAVLVGLIPNGSDPNRGMALTQSETVRNTDPTSGSASRG